MRRVGTTFLSCGEPVRSTTVVVVNGLDEDEGKEQVLVVHDSCQNALVKGLPCRSASAPEKRS